MALSMHSVYSAFYTKMLNVIIVAGNATSDPTIRNTATGKTIATVRLAVNNPLNDEEVLYIDIDCWDKQADFVQKYVKKGNSLSAVGRLKSRSFTGDDNVKRTAYSIVCERINFIGSKKKSDNAESDAGKEVIDDEAFAATAAKAMAKLKAKASPAPQAPVGDEQF
jgi:single-strand DNA-binding protein